MKYYSRLIALLLAVMMLMTNIVMASGINMNDLTLTELESMYAVLADDEVTYPGDVLGSPCTMYAFSNVYDKAETEFVWYDEFSTEPIATGDVLTVEYTMSQQKYTCKAVKQGNVLDSQVFIILPAQVTDVEKYVDYLWSEHYYICIEEERSEQEYIQRAYNLMRLWDFEVTENENLAAKVLIATAAVDNEYNDPIICTCYLSDDGQSVIDPAIVKAPYEQHDENCLWHSDVIIPPMPEKLPLYGGDPQGNQYTSNETYNLADLGNRAVILPKGGRAVIQTGETTGYQWQVFDGTQWIDIQGETAADIAVTDAKLNTIFELTGIAELRYFAKDSSIVLASVSVTSQEIAGGEYVAEVETAHLSLNERAEGDAHYATIHYRYETEGGDVVIESKSIQWAEGETPVSLWVPHPTVMGYEPTKGSSWDAEMDVLFAYEDTGVNCNISGLTGNVNVYVVYKPIEVNYAIVYYLQDVLDNVQNQSTYTAQAPVPMKGKTGTVVPEITTAFDGFYQLKYERPTIAADGTTIVPVYYDRNYYMMNFDLSGGYGVEPVYARFGAEIDTTDFNPQRNGYIFTGWVDDQGNSYATLPETLTMPDENITYTAQWSSQYADYTIVYWRENADPDKDADGNVIMENGQPKYSYSYWTQTIGRAPAGSLVSGSDSVDEVTGENAVDDEDYFTFNAGKTDKNVVIKGDGSSVVNVYYMRNEYTLIFYYNGDCNYTHTHSAACQPLVCGYEAHTHGENGENCEYKLICQASEQTLTGHTHSEACCTKVVHTQHTDECCSAVHVHDKTCYGIRANAQPQNPGGNNRPSNPREGQVYVYTTGNWWGETEYRYIYVAGSWYTYDQTVSNNTIVTPSCSGVHEHNVGNCNCPIEIHEHGDGDCDCGRAPHSHTTACYGYSCGKVNHTHQASCYKECQQLVHTHASGCTYGGNSDQKNYKIFTVITAKYDSYIGDQWPTADDIPGFAYWTGTGVPSGGQSSKIMTMTANICVNGGNKFLAHYNSTKYQLNYWFEDFDQTSTTISETRVRWRDGSNGTYKYYVLSDFTQVSYYGSTSTWGYKDITGMKPAEADESASRTTENNTYTFNLYYDRLRYDLKFYNVNQWETGLQHLDVMYGMPIKNIIPVDANGKPVDDDTTDADTTGKYWLEDPQYPIVDNKIYEFLGWYTTPECYDGTEFDFTTGTMPNSDMTLYAKWLPVSRTVTFYLTEQELTNQNPLTGEEYQKVVRQGDVIGKVSAPDRSPYQFVGWFYWEEEGDHLVAKAINFESMPINDDLEVFARWSSNDLVPYTVKYVLQGTETEIAAPTTGQALAGVTRTFNAKVGEELDPGYQTGFFPVIKSHNLMLHIDYVDANGDPIIDEDSKQPRNTYKFEYVWRNAVPYIVRYVDKDGNELIPDKVVADNRASVRTETFVVCPGYMPDAYQKRLILNGAETLEAGQAWIEAKDAQNNTVLVHPDNVITFIYTPNDKEAYYKVTHYKKTGDGYIEYRSEQYIGKIGSDEYEEDQLSIAGFKWVKTEYVVGNNDPVTVAPELTEDGLEINLYYDPEEYHYIVHYKELGTGAILADSEIKFGAYNESVTETAKAIDGYVPVDNTKELTIRIENKKIDGVTYTEDQFTLNVITFYYEQLVSLNYEVVGPAGCGTVDLNAVADTPADKVSETVKRVSGQAKGATVTVNEPAFEFLGWYTKDPATGKFVEVQDGTGTHITNVSFVPTKNPNSPWIDGTTYYALFEYNLTSMSITKKGMSAGESAIFTVTNAEDSNDTWTVVVANDTTVTLYGLTVGSTYNIAEAGDWSWRYNATAISPKSIKIDADPAKNKVEITNEKTNDHWVSDENGVINTYTETTEGNATIKQTEME